MEKERIIHIQNLFNGELLTFNKIEDANFYINQCIKKDIPITIKYGYKYVN